MARTPEPKMSTTPYRNGNSSNANITAWAAIAISVGLAFFNAVNPKSDVQQIKTDYQADIRQAKIDLQGEIRQVKQDLREDVKHLEERWERELSQIKWDINNKVLTISQHNEFASRIEKAADVLRDEINRIRIDQVSRSEHLQHWSETTERLNALNLRIKDVSTEQNLVNESMRKEFGSTFTAGDQMKNLQDQIKTLQNRLDAITRSTGTSVPSLTPHLSPTTYDR